MGTQLRNQSRSSSSRRGPRILASIALAGIALAAVSLSASSAYAVTAVGLGTAGSYVVIGGQSVTNTGPSVLGGDLGVYPGTSITGFPPGILVGGTTHATDANAQQAQTDVTTAYNNAAGQAPDATSPTDLGGQTLVQGVYSSLDTAALTGTLTLDGQGDPGAVWVFQVGSALTTASGSSVSLTNGALACNVFWQVGSSATLGTNSNFVGTILALTSVSVTTGTTVEGRAFARNGSVTLDTNVFTSPNCTPSTPTATPTPTPTPSASATTPVTPAGPGTPGTPGGSGPVSPAGPGAQGQPGVAAGPSGGTPFLGSEITAAERLPVTGGGGPTLWIILSAVGVIALGGVVVAIAARRHTKGAR